MAHASRKKLDCDDRYPVALRRQPSDEVTRQTIEVMRREHDRISAQITELITTRDDLAYLIDAAAAFRRDHLNTDMTLVGTAPELVS